MSDLESTYADFPKPSVDFSAPGALRALCRGGAGYETSRADVQPYAKERISWPPPPSTPSQMLDGVPTNMDWLRQWDRHLLRDPLQAQAERDSLGLAAPCIDPNMRHNSIVYGDFLASLADAGMLSWARTDSLDFGLGVFCIAKKDGVRLRLFFDTRIVNAGFVPPPRMSTLR